MSERDFAIVCDSGCDLPPAFLERAGVVLVDLGPSGAGGEQDLSSRLERTYRDLAARGYARVASVHSAASFSPAILRAREAAEACTGVCEVEVVDSGAASAATGMLVDRISRYRYFGVEFDEAVEAVRQLAGQVRLLVVPTAKAHFARRRTHRERQGILGRATASLRMRVSGERGLFLLSRGEVTQLARATDLVELTSRLAHAMSAVSAGEGPVTYALVETGDPRALRAVEKPLDTNEFESRCLGTVCATPAVEEVVGAGAVAVAFAPESAYSREVPPAPAETKD